jgi:16S rRNA (cytidine1402-2'-O)-methyltransferase
VSSIECKNLRALFPGNMLFLIPTYLSPENTGVLPEGTLRILHTLKEFVVENEKSARQFLKKSNSPFAQSEFIFHELSEHTTVEQISELGNLLTSGKPIGLMSEAGCPGIADPGAQLVAIAHEKKIKIVPLTGPSSIFLALMASGLNGQSFVFHGYFPREQAQRKNRIRDIERDVIKKDQTQIIIETPYRNQHLLNDIMEVCSDETILCIASNVTAPNEIITSKPVSAWKKHKINLDKIPAVFLLGNFSGGNNR